VNNTKYHDFINRIAWEKASAFDIQSICSCIPHFPENFNFEIASFLKNQSIRRYWFLYIQFGLALL